MKDINSVVEALAERFDTRDPYELCDRLGIHVTANRLPCTIRGFYFKSLEMDFIQINSRLCENDQRLICAHELGHYLLHPGMNSIFLSRSTHLNGDRLELEADLFAACLLIPDSAFQDCFSETLTFAELAAQLSLPERFLLLKYNSLRK